MIIDAEQPPTGNAGWFGKTFRAYGVSGIPQAALIDRKGNLVLVGEFSQIIARAAALIAQKE